MPTESVLVEVITTANMAGVEEAKLGMLGLSAAAIGVGLALAAVVLVGKAGLENYKKQEEATNLLKQATDSQGMSLGYLLDTYEKFKVANAGFISDQYDTEAALAAVVRSGETEEDAMRILNDALDLAAIKHEAVSEAATALVKVLAGNSKALKELGITTEQYNAIVKDKTLSTEQKHLELLTLIEARTAKGRDTIDQTTQSQNKLTLEWQDFTARTGPGVTSVLQGMNEAAAALLESLIAIGDTLGHVGDWLQSISSLGAATSGNRGGVSPHASTQRTAAPAATPEVHIHIDQGAYIDGPSTDHLANVIAQRLGYGPTT